MNLQHKSSFLLVLVIVFAVSFRGRAQTEPDKFTAKNAVYLQLGGNAGLYSFNYGRIIYQKGKFKLNTSAGFSMIPRRLNSKTSWLPAVPLEISALYGRSNHHLELGFGVTPFLDRTLAFNSQTLETNDKVVFRAAMPFRLGYRFQKPEGGFFFRVGYTPGFSIPTERGEDWSFSPVFAGLSFGTSF
jgi:hypothetical protein